MNTDHMKPKPMNEAQPEDIKKADYSKFTNPGLLKSLQRFKAIRRLKIPLTVGVRRPRLYASPH
jgi:hypothetical protein